MTERTIKAILDTTAVIYYMSGSLPVGELLAEIADEQGAVAVPELCLAEAAAALDHTVWPALDVLTGLPYCVALPLPHWRDLAPLLSTLGPSSASALIWTAAYGAHLLTGDAARYGYYDDEVSIIEV